MAKIVILGAGIAGHTAATHLRRKLGKNMKFWSCRPIEITNGFLQISG